MKALDFETVPRPFRELKTPSFEKRSQALVILERDSSFLSTNACSGIIAAVGVSLNYGVVKMERQFFDLNACWQRVKKTWPIPMTEREKYLPKAAADKRRNGTIMVESSMPILWEMLFLQNHFTVERCGLKMLQLSDLFLTQDGTVLSRWNANQRRYIVTEIEIFSLLPGVVHRCAFSDLFTTSPLAGMRLLISGIIFCSNCCNYITVKVSAFVMSCVLKISCSAIGRRVCTLWEFFLDLHFLSHLSPSQLPDQITPSEERRLGHFRGNGEI